MSKRNKSAGQNVKASKCSNKQSTLDEEIKEKERSQLEEKHLLEKSKKQPISVMSLSDSCLKERNKKTKNSSVLHEQNSTISSFVAVLQKQQKVNDYSKNNQEQIPLPPPPLSVTSAALLQETTGEQVLQNTGQKQQQQQVADSHIAFSPQEIQSLISLSSRLESTQTQITEKNVLFESQLQSLQQACKQQQTTIHQLYSLIQNFDVHILPEKKLYFRTLLMQILQQILDACIAQPTQTQTEEHQEQPQAEPLEGKNSKEDVLNHQGQSMVEEIQVVPTTELQQNQPVQPLLKGKQPKQLKQITQSQQSKERVCNNPEAQLGQQHQAQLQPFQQSNVSTEQESTAAGVLQQSSIDIFLEDISLISHSPRQTNHSAANESSFESLKQQIKSLGQGQQEQKKKKDQKHVRIQEKEESKQEEKITELGDKEQVQKEMSQVSRKRASKQKEQEKEGIEEGSVPAKKMKKK